MNRLLILAEDADNYLSLIKTAGLSGLDVVTATGQKQAMEQVRDCNIILGEPALIEQVLASASQLQWAQSSWAGVDRLCQPQHRTDYVLTGVKDIFGAMITEYVMTYVFAFERNLFEMRDDQSRRHWQPRPYRLARDIQLGIIGLGSIGQHLAKTAADFDIRVTGFNRSGQPCEGVEKVYTEENLAGFLAQLDYLVLTLPDTPRTRHFINSNTLAMMKSSVTLINVGRGGIINEDDLVVALQDQQIGAAVLDVFESEPLPQESLLWELPSVYVTPHVAAASFPQDVVDIFVQNYGRFSKGEPLLHVVDFERGY
jgi:phosphoglycerate dehydrogenase-like enzyme